MIELLPEVAPIRRGSRQMVRELGFLDARLGSLGISHSECHTLVELDTSGALTTQEVADRLNLDKSTVSRMLSRMGDRGWVLSSTDKADARKKPFRLSASGRRFVERIHGHANEQVEAALHLLPPEDRETVARGIALYARALERRRRQRAFTFRPIRPEDDEAVAELIRTVMPEFGCMGAGYASEDPEVDAMSATYVSPSAGYYVLVNEGRVVGGAGFGPLAGGRKTVCELRKMYFLPEARGLGLGRVLLLHILESAKEAGFKTCYLETTERMYAAGRLYESVGFERLDSPMGKTGHHACDAWYRRSLRS